MNKTKKVLIVTLSLVAILSIFLTYKAYMNKPVMLDDIKYSENTINKKKFGIFVEKSSYSSEQDKYEVYSGTTWPNGYSLNTTKSVCVDENGDNVPNALSVSGSTITLSTTKSAYCYLYFDIPSTPFVNIGTDSTTGLPVVKVTGTNEEFYDITNVIDYNSLDPAFLTKINYDATKSILLAKYNLYVGQTCTSTDSSSCTPISTSATGYGLQSADAKGWIHGESQWVGVVPFAGSSDKYWGYWGLSGISTYGTYTNYANNVYDKNRVTAPDYSAAITNSSVNANYSIAYYVEEYVDRLGIEGTGRLLTYPEANAMTQAQRNNGATSWVGSAGDEGYIMVMTYYSGGMMPEQFFNVYVAGVRPVIVVDISSIS